MLKIGVVGAGHLGKIHLKILLELQSQFQLVGFFDANPSVRKEVEALFGVKAYDSLDLLINDTDCLDIVTPTTYHFETAALAIKNSRHCFIEKPITQTVEEGKKLITLAQEANVKVQIGHVERFNPAFLEAKPFLKTPLFIETHRLAQFNPRGTDVPVVLDLMIHDLDIILSTVKANIRRISASGVAVVSDTPDIANARIEFDNGCVANLTASRISLKNMRKSRFFQKDAYISVDFLDRTLEVVEMENVVGEPGPFDMIMELGEGKPSKKITINKPEINNLNAIKEELINFGNAIKNNVQPIVTIEDGYQALLVADQIMEKVNNNVQKFTQNI